MEYHDYNALDNLRINSSQNNIINTNKGVMSYHYVEN